MMIFKNIRGDEALTATLTAQPSIPKTIYTGFLKRAVDVLLVLMLAPFVLPLILTLALIVRMDGGRAFYSQPRIGRDGRTFRFWKLRSMVPDAEAVLARTLAEDQEAARVWAEHQKLPNDPRITPIGRLLRKSSLDELPQLWNVLIGDMSLVGPRPFLPEQKPLYPGLGYYCLRPGLTGLWQVSDRNRCSFAKRADYDNRYAAKVTFGLDLSILFQTAFVVVRGTGI